MKKLLSLIVGLFIFVTSASADMLIVYPDAGTGGITVDGWMRNQDTGGLTWSNIRDSANGDATFPSVTASSVASISTDTTTDDYDTMSRGDYLYDSSSLGSSAVISSAVKSIYGTTKVSTITGQTDLVVCSSNPASNNNLVVGDYSQVGRVSFGSITYAAYSTSSYNDITLNASGIANINKTGISKFSVQIEADRSDTEPTWGSSQDISYSGYWADEPTLDKDPKLVIIYSAAQQDDTNFFGINI